MERRGVLRPIKMHRSPNAKTYYSMDNIKAIAKGGASKN
jgi:hypothetical protein